MTINIVLNKHPFYFDVRCKIYGASNDELQILSDIGLKNNSGWGGADIPSLNGIIRKACSWAQNNKKELVVKELTVI